MRIFILLFVVSGYLKLHGEDVHQLTQKLSKESCYIPNSLFEYGYSYEYSLNFNVSNRFVVQIVNETASHEIYGKCLLTLSVGKQCLHKLMFKTCTASQVTHEFQIHPQTVDITEIFATLEKSEIIFQTNENEISHVFHSLNDGTDIVNFKKSIASAIWITNDIDGLTAKPQKLRDIRGTCLTVHASDQYASNSSKDEVNLYRRKLGSTCEQNEFAKNTFPQSPFNKNNIQMLVNAFTQQNVLCQYTIKKSEKSLTFINCTETYLTSALGSVAVANTEMKLLSKQSALDIDFDVALADNTKFTKSSILYQYDQRKLSNYDFQQSIKPKAESLNSIARYLDEIRVGHTQIEPFNIAAPFENLLREVRIASAEDLSSQSDLLFESEKNMDIRQIYLEALSQADTIESVAECVRLITAKLLSPSQRQSVIRRLGMLTNTNLDMVESLLKLCTEFPNDDQCLYALGSSLDYARLNYVNRKHDFNTTYARVVNSVFNHFVQYITDNCSLETSKYRNVQTPEDKVLLQLTAIKALLNTRETIKDTSHNIFNELMGCVRNINSPYLIQISAMEVLQYASSDILQYTDLEDFISNPRYSLGVRWAAFLQAFSYEKTYDIATQAWYNESESSQFKSLAGTYFNTILSVSEPFYHDWVVGVKKSLAKLPNIPDMSYRHPTSHSQTYLRSIPFHAPFIGSMNLHVFTHVIYEREISFIPNYVVNYFILQYGGAFYPVYELGLVGGGQILEDLLIFFNEFAQSEDYTIIYNLIGQTAKEWVKQNFPDIDLKIGGMGNILNTIIKNSDLKSILQNIYENVKSIANNRPAFDRNQEYNPPILFYKLLGKEVGHISLKKIMGYLKTGASKNVLLQEFNFLKVFKSMEHMSIIPTYSGLAHQITLDGILGIQAKHKMLSLSKWEFYRSINHYGAVSSGFLGLTPKNKWELTKTFFSVFKVVPNIQFNRKLSSEITITIDAPQESPIYKMRKDMYIYTNGKRIDWIHKPVSSFPCDFAKSLGFYPCCNKSYGEFEKNSEYLISTTSFLENPLETKCTMKFLVKNVVLKYEQSYPIQGSPSRIAFSFGQNDGSIKIIDLFYEKTHSKTLYNLNLYNLDDTTNIDTLSQSQSLQLNRLQNISHVLTFEITQQEDQLSKANSLSFNYKSTQLTFYFGGFRKVTGNALTIDGSINLKCIQSCFLLDTFEIKLNHNRLINHERDAIVITTNSQIFHNNESKFNAIGEIRHSKDESKAIWKGAIKTGYSDEIPFNVSIRYSSRLGKINSQLAQKDESLKRFDRDYTKELLKHKYDWEIRVNAVHNFEISNILYTNVDSFDGKIAFIYNMGEQKYGFILDHQTIGKEDIQYDDANKDQHVMQMEQKNVKIVPEPESQLDITKLRDSIQSTYVFTIFPLDYKLGFYLAYNLTYGDDIVLKLWQDAIDIKSGENICNTLAEIKSMNGNIYYHLNHKSPIYLMNLVGNITMESGKIQTFNSMNGTFLPLELEEYMAKINYVDQFDVQFKTEQNPYSLNYSVNFDLITDNDNDSWSSIINMNGMTGWIKEVSNIIGNIDTTLKLNEDGNKFEFVTLYYPKNFPNLPPIKAATLTLDLISPNGISYVYFEDANFRDFEYKYLKEFLKKLNLIEQKFLALISVGRSAYFTIGHMYISFAKDSLLRAKSKQTVVGIYPDTIGDLSYIPQTFGYIKQIFSSGPTPSFEKIWKQLEYYDNIMKYEDQVSTITNKFDITNDILNNPNDMTGVFLHPFKWVKLTDFPNLSMDTLVKALHLHCPSFFSNDKMTMVQTTAPKFAYYNGLLFGLDHYTAFDGSVGRLQPFCHAKTEQPKSHLLVADYVSHTFALIGNRYKFSLLTPWHNLSLVIINEDTKEYRVFLNNVLLSTLPLNDRKLYVFSSNNNNIKIRYPGLRIGYNFDKKVTYIKVSKIYKGKLTGVFETFGKNNYFYQLTNSSSSENSCQHQISQESNTSAVNKTDEECIGIITYQNGGNKWTDEAIETIRESENDGPCSELFPYQIMSNFEPCFRIIRSMPYYHACLADYQESLCKKTDNDNDKKSICSSLHAYKEICYAHYVEVDVPDYCNQYNGFNVGDIWEEKLNTSNSDHINVIFIVNPHNLTSNMIGSLDLLAKGISLHCKKENYLVKFGLISQKTKYNHSYPVIYANKLKLLTKKSSMFYDALLSKQQSELKIRTEEIFDKLFGNYDLSDSLTIVIAITQSDHIIDHYWTYVNQLFNIWNHGTVINVITGKSHIFANNELEHGFDITELGQQQRQQRARKVMSPLKFNITELNSFAYLTQGSVFDYHSVFSGNLSEKKNVIRKISETIIKQIKSHKDNCKICTITKNYVGDPFPECRFSENCIFH